MGGTLLLGVTMWWAAEPLARHTLGGRPADPVVHARLLNVVDGLCATIGAHQPEVKVRPETGLNAAVCGRRRKSATLVVTQALLDELTRVELEGVVAQQLTRIRCYDMLPATVTVATLGIGATMLSPPEPITAMDRAAVSFTRYPPGLVGRPGEARGEGHRGARRLPGQRPLVVRRPGRRPRTSDGLERQDRSPARALRPGYRSGRSSAAAR